MKTRTIDKDVFNFLNESLNTNKYANHICNSSSKLGEVKTFSVKGTDLTIKLKCTQIGGMFTGSYCFVPVK